MDGNASFAGRMCPLRMETPLRRRSGGHTGAAPTISRVAPCPKVGGRGSADGLKQEKVTGRGSADGLKRKRLPEEAPPMDKNKKRLPEEALPMDKYKK